MTDARFCHVHMSEAQIRMLDFADGDEREGFGRLPGYDEAIDVPLHLEPTRVDEEETLPTDAHPSYPLGRPLYSSFGGMGGLGGSGRKAAGSKGLMSMWSSREVGLGFGTKNATILHNTWPELGLLASSKDGGFLGGILEAETSSEIPPQMAGAKRPPSPLPLALFVSDVAQRVNAVARPHGVPQTRQALPDASASSSLLPLPDASGAVDEHTMDMLVEDEEMLLDDEDDFPSRPGPSRPRPRPRFSEHRGGSSLHRRTSNSSQSLMDESLEEASHDYNRSTSTEGSRRRSGRVLRSATEDSQASISTGTSASGRPRRAAAIAAVASMRSNG